MTPTADSLYYTVLSGLALYFLAMLADSLIVAIGAARGSGGEVEAPDEPPATMVLWRAKDGMFCEQITIVHDTAATTATAATTKHMRSEARHVDRAPRRRSAHPNF